MKCGKCKYKAPSEIHGMGEYWGYCKALDYLHNKTRHQEDEIDLGEVIFKSDEDDCLIAKAIRYYREHR